MFKRAADLIEINGGGFRRTDWNELAMVGHWRRYLSDPEAYLHHVLD